jgi:hypothetical protein
MSETCGSASDEYSLLTNLGKLNLVRKRASNLEPLSLRLQASEHMLSMCDPIVSRNRCDCGDHFKWFEVQALAMQ